MKKNKSKMTRIMPKMAIVLVAIVFIFSLFKIGTTKASTDVVEITKVEIATKSDTTDVDSVKFEDGKIKNNVTFHKVGDYLTYNVTITNKEDKNYVLKTISDNNGNECLTYSYSGYEGAKLEASKAATFQVTITYSREVENVAERDQSNLVALTLTFEDETGNEKDQEVVVDPTDEKTDDNTPTEENKDNTTNDEEKTNPAEDKKDDSSTDSNATNNSASNSKSNDTKDVTPQTGDNIGVYIATAVASFVLLVVLSRRQFITSKKANKSSKAKHGKKILGLILAIALVVPTFSNVSKAATTYTLNTTLDTSIKFMDKLVVSYVVGNETKEQVIPYNGTIADLEEPTQDGFNFTGWATEDGTPLTEETKITEDTEIVAQFEELAKTSEITITVEDERTRDFSKNVTLSAVNTNISDDKVKLQYSLDDGATWTDYSDTIVLEENLTLKVRTVVKDSNAVIGEAEKEINSIIVDIATFKPGPVVNSTIMKLAGGPDDLVLEGREVDIGEELRIGYSKMVTTLIPWSGDQPYEDTNIKEIKKATTAQYNEIKDTLTENNVVSTEDSVKPIYMWFADEKIYYYSEAEVIFLNENSSGMFTYMSDVTSIDVTEFDTRKVTNMNSMFANSYGLQTLDVSNFDTKNVTDMANMFNNLPILTTLDVGGFDTSNVTDMTMMFYMNGANELDLSKFDTSNVTDMFLMFYYDGNLQELDLSNFDTSKVTDMTGMFAACTGLTTIYASDKFDVSNVEHDVSMFYTPAIVGENGTTFAYDHMDKEYARIDTDETPGYFTGWKCTIKIDGTVVKDSTKLAKGDQKVLTVSDCDEAVTYTSSDTNVITIDSNGNITAVGYGSAKITVTGIETGSKKSINLEVKIKYSTTLGGEQYDSYWQIFHKEDGYVYLILDDYLPNNKVNIEGIQKDASYNVYVNTNRADLINAMTNEEYWNSLLAGTIGNNTFDYRESTDEKIMAMGSPTLDLFVESWNANHPDQQLYTAKNNDMTDSIGWGYYVGQSENPTSTYTQVSNSDLLYFPHPSMTSPWNGCYGYWLASPSAAAAYGVVYVNYQGRMNHYTYGNSIVAFRPVVCLPSSVLE